ncbi:GNAT family N-acetyltransferase [Schumannella luteola]|uniref:Putative acetyltransferase n=1 Tax=Schumannella luteola TaxID=472059 RepID=A0A852YAY4_9MICO|nr:putative acetyltransferase [Schumannella luteola]TPX06666.1 GNAT family N-acetyltransferase [Schumannella luteola]
MTVLLRPYSPADAEATLAVFLAAVISTASADYSPEQIAAWAAPEQRSVIDWDAARRRSETIVAVVDGRIAGFSDVDDSGCIDMMFVHPDHGGRGVASALLAEVADRARAGGAEELSSSVSVTARPFFAARGFEVLAEQRPVRHGVELVNYRMRRSLDG